MLKTERYTFLLLVLICGASYCSAQTENKSEGLKKTRPLAGQANGWREFVFKDRGFKIQFPGSPKETSFSKKLDSGKHVTVYGALYSTTYNSTISYQVLSMDYSIDEKDQGAVERFLENYLSSEFKSYLSINMKPVVLIDKPISQEGHPGRYLEFELAPDRVNRRKVVIADDRVYSINVIILENSKNISTGEDSNLRLSMKFIDSFKLIKEPDRETTKLV